MMKKIGVFTVLLSFGLGLTSWHPRHFHFADGKIKTLVIDAGHGGKDPGAHGDETWEKNVTLAIALELKMMLKEQHPELKIIMTRENDKFIELHNRAKTAYGNNADFFISIHCNANTSKVPFGSESYVMGLHKEGANLDLIMNENKSILMEDNYEKEYEGFDPSKPETYILFSLIKNGFLKQSISLAKKCESHFVANGKSSRGVKQAGFLVLWKAATPSILIETGFISNKDDEKFLNSEAGRKSIATSVFKAIGDYNKEME